jgi:hypothetical protein
VDESGEESYITWESKTTIRPKETEAWYVDNEDAPPTSELLGC